MTKRQYAPREQDQRAGTQSRLAFPGSSAGAVRNAYPIHKADRTAVRVPTSTTLSAESFWVEDHFTVTSTSPGTFALSYVPRTNSEDITVNGVTLLPTTEWTRSGVTLTVDSGVWLGLTGTWDLLVQYEVASSVATAATGLAPTFAYIATASDAVGTPVTLTSAVTPGDVGFFVCLGFSTAVSGGFATWTKLFSGGGGKSVDVWMGTGVGTGTSVTGTFSSGEYAGADSVKLVAVLHDAASTPTLLHTTSSATGSQANPTAAPLATAAVGNLVVSAWYGECAFVSGIYSDGTHTDTGFVGHFGEGHVAIGNAAGAAISIGIATATSVGSSFGINVSGTAGGQAVNLVMGV